MAILGLEQVSYGMPIGTDQQKLTPILQDISFEVQAGDFVAILGSSGAGKTSLLQLINRLREVTTGKITLEGQDIRQIPIVQLRQRVPLLLQESKLLGLTVQETLAYPLKLRGISPQEIQSRVRDWRERLHIPAEWLDRTEVQLSLGQRQWVAIARVLVIQPQILLMDEPTASLDAGRADHGLTVLKELTQNQGLTVLMINHQLELMQQFSSRVLYLQAGHLVQDQPSSQVHWPELRDRMMQAEAQAAADWL